jgi:hypothetical protein
VPVPVWVTRRNVGSTSIDRGARRAWLHPDFADGAPLCCLQKTLSRAASGPQYSFGWLDMVNVMMLGSPMWIGADWREGGQVGQLAARLMGVCGACAALWAAKVPIAAGVPGDPPGPHVDAVPQQQQCWEQFLCICITRCMRQRHRCLLLRALSQGVGRVALQQAPYPALRASCCRGAASVLCWCLCPWPPAAVELCSQPAGPVKHGLRSAGSPVPASGAFLRRFRLWWMDQQRAKAWLSCLLLS